jgi:hypothetical protein
MTVSILYGQPGTGKTTAATQKAIDYAVQGRRVYANYPIDFAPITRRAKTNLSKASCWVIPDRPTREDLEQLKGGETEEKSALLIIDEAGMWLNTRAWSSDKSRMEVIDWLTQSRKRGFDVMLIAQHPNMLDKQVRDGCIELFGRCRNMAKVKILGLFRLPRFHICRFQFDMSPSSPVLERFIYRGSDAHQTYDTRKAFGADSCHYSVLPATLTRWRYFVSDWDKFKEKIAGYFHIDNFRVRVIEHKPKLSLVSIIMKLPEEKRTEFFNRFNRTGAFERCLIS